MNVNDLPDIINNKDLTQHFLYSYSHQSKIGPSNKLKEMFADDLIFDRSRKSIFAQYQEFGYICDKYVSINMGSYQGTSSSYIDIFSYEGEINAYSFVPWYASDFTVNLSTSKKIIPFGSTVNINNFSWKNNGSEGRLHFYEDDIDNPIQYRSTTMDYCKISYYLNDNNTQLSNVVKNNIGNVSVVPSIISIYANEIGKLKFELEIACSECPDLISKQIIDDYEVANYFIVAKTTEYVTGNFENVKDFLESPHTGVHPYYWNTVVKVLTNDIRKYTNENPIQCDNGNDIYYFVGIPSRIHNDSVLYGSLNYGCAQEFIKIDASETIIRSLIGGNYNEEYFVYLATNHTWDGSQLIFNSFKHTRSSLYIENLSSEECTITLSKSGSPDSITLNYSIDDQQTWSSLSGDDEITIIIPANSKVYLNGNNSSFSTSDGDYYSFSFDQQCNVGGELMSLVGGSEDILDNMFNGLFEGNDNVISCMNLILPNSVAYHCYENMFSNCTSLITAPTLPATSLTEGCYNNMFENCSNLNYIKALFTTEPSSIYMNNWVSGVSSVGTFIKNSEATWNEIGVNGIPSGWITSNDFSNTFWIENISSEDCTVALTKTGSPTDIVLDYSIDNKQTWNTLTTADTLSFTIPANGKAYLKGNNSTFSISNSKYYKFNFDKQCNVGGEIMSLVGGISNIGAYMFYGLFYQNTNIISVENLIFPDSIANYCYNSMFRECTSLMYSPLILPPLVLNEACYSRMFYGCTALITTPILPATTLTTDCCWDMFQSCTSLTTPPELPATILGDYCYQGMFYNCTSLTTAPELPATVLREECYFGMFAGCTSLTTAPALPATTLGLHCYWNMFQNCTSLINAPELPATTLTTYCYQAMFEGCISLVNAPALPATTLADYCYNSMFKGCTSLVNAPELPATTLIERCYNCMFENCSNLNYIKAMFTTAPSSTYTSNWVSGVSSTGTFVKNAAATWDETGLNGIPSGWTIETAVA